MPLAALGTFIFGSVGSALMVDLNWLLVVLGCSSYIHCCCKYKPIAACGGVVAAIMLYQLMYKKDRSYQLLLMVLLLVL